MRAIDSTRDMNDDGSVTLTIHPKRALSEAAQLVFNHLAFKHERERVGMTVDALAACRQTPAVIEAALTELYGHQLARETAGVWTLTARGVSCTGFVCRSPSELAVALVTAEDGIANEIDGELLARLLAENAPRQWATALLVDEGRVVAQEREYPGADVRSWALNWWERGLSGRIVVIERDYPSAELNVYEFDRRSREWLPLRATSHAVNRLRDRPSALARP